MDISGGDPFGFVFQASPADSIKDAPRMARTPKAKRTERLQIMHADVELQAVDDWRYDNRIPTRAAAIRELLRRGMVAENLAPPEPNAESGEYSVVDDDTLTYIPLTER